MSIEETVKPKKIEILEKKPLQLLGCVYYGDPFHSTEAWSEQNEIGLTWQRFMKLYEKYKDSIERQRISPNLEFEVHIEPEEYKQTKKFYVFVGVEVVSFEELPLEMFGKVFPATKYAVFTFQGKQMFNGGQSIWHEWLPSSEYQEAHPFFMEVYDARRFLGMNNEDSELDYYIPIKFKD
jgi:AraC family transcriptional regulator